jgi:DNA-binding NtrC family response regulator
MTAPTTILLIDHDEDVMSSRKLCLESAGLRVLTWPWSASTIPTVRPPPELVLVDLDSLEGQSLADFVRQVAKVAGRSVVLMGDPEIVDLAGKARRAGALGCISKSLDAEAFVLQVRSQLRRKQRFTGRNEPLSAEALDALRRDKV